MQNVAQVTGKRRKKAAAASAAPTPAATATSELRDNGQCMERRANRLPCCIAETLPAATTAAAAATAADSEEESVSEVKKAGTGGDG